MATAERTNPIVIGTNETYLCQLDNADSGWMDPAHNGSSQLEKSDTKFLTKTTNFDVYFAAF